MGVELAPGALVGGRYRLDRSLGDGGMGSVWAATHTVTLRTVALKFLTAPAHLKAELRKRFLREARAASAINHPNVVQVHDLFELDSETPVMVMDLLEGETLAQLLSREGQLLLDEAAGIMLQVVSAVGTAHGLGIVHRDLKPDNVFIAESGGHRIVKVLDFGIAKLSSDNPLITEGGVITNNRTMLGTPCYMAPEQSLGEPDVDHRADIWAIGAMLYEMLAGKRAVDGANVREVLKELLTGSIKPIQELVFDVPRDVCELIAQMLAYERSERPEDLREVHDMLRKYSSVSARTFAAPASTAFEPAVSKRHDSSDFGCLKGVTTRPRVDPAAQTEHDRPPTTVAAEPILDRPVTTRRGRPIGASGERTARDGGSRNHCGRGPRHRRVALRLSRTCGRHGRGPEPRGRERACGATSACPTGRKDC